MSSIITDAVKAARTGTRGAGRHYEYPGDPVARGAGTPVRRVEP